jgi:hypothetical protein
VNRNATTLKKNQEVGVPGSIASSFVRYSSPEYNRRTLESQEKIIAKTKKTNIINKYSVNLCFFSKYLLKINTNKVIEMKIMTSS